MEQRRQALLFEGERISESSHRMIGWREQSQQKILAEKDLRSDMGVVSAFTQTLAGADAKRIGKWQFEGSRVAFRADDQRVIFSVPGGGAREFDVSEGTERNLKGLQNLQNSAGMGPLAFDADQKPVQVNFLSPWRFAVTELGKPNESRELKLPTRDLPDDWKIQWSDFTDKDKPAKRDQLDKLAQATPNMSHVVAWHGIPKGAYGEETSDGIVVLWDLRTGKSLKSVSAQASALAVSSDGRFFAIGDNEGTVIIRSSTSDEVLLIPTVMRRINTMAFGRNPRFPKDNPAVGLKGWLLAIGDHSGRIEIRDLATGSSITTFHGTVHQINTLKFSTDSLALISAGHYEIQFWDTYGHGHYLTIPAGGRYDVALSNDGTMFAYPGNNHFQNNPNHEARLWKIELDRGIKTLRGLSSAGAKVVFSSDSRSIAAVANDWTIGIWDVQTSKLKCLLQAMPGLTIDNCGLRFSDDGNSFFFSAGKEMAKFDIATAVKTRTWVLPKYGVLDRIGLTKDGRVLLMRYERDNSGKVPLGQFDLRFVRLREMHHDGTQTILLPNKENNETNYYYDEVYSITGTSDGKYFIVDGESKGDGRTTIVVDGDTLKTTSIPLTRNNKAPTIIAEDAGFFLANYSLGGAKLFQLRDAAQIGRGLPGCSSISRDGKFGFRLNQDSKWCDLHKIETGRRLVRILLSAIPSRFQSAFSPDGKFAAWANENGTVTVCDIDRLREELKQIIASW